MVYHLQKGSPAIDAASGNYSSITVDMDGQRRISPLDVGADEVSKDKITARILQPADVGHTAADKRE